MYELHSREPFRLDLLHHPANLYIALDKKKHQSLPRDTQPEWLDDSVLSITYISYRIMTHSHSQKDDAAARIR